MKNTTRRIAGAVASLATAITLAVSLAAPAPAQATVPATVSRLAAAAHCIQATPMRYGFGGANSGVSCKAKRPWGKVRVSILRYKNIERGIGAWREATGYSELWGSGPGCFVKKGRHVLAPSNGDSVTAQRWCSYLQRRVGGRIITGNAA